MTKKTITRSLNATATVGLFAALCTLAPTTAQAKERTVHGGICHSHVEDGVDYRGVYYSNGHNGIASVHCHIPDDSFLPHDEARSVHLHGFAPTTGPAMKSRACVRSPYSTVIACGPTVTWRRGNRTFPASLWNELGKWGDHSSWIPYIRSDVPRNGRIYGIRIRD